MVDKRHFTIVLDNKEQGLFTGKNPSSVAKKAVSKLSKGKKVIFELREITQGSKKKVYGPYEGVKKKLDKPVTLGDRVYKYESIVKKIDGAKSSKGGYIGNVSSHSTVMLELKTDDGKRITIEKTRKGVGEKISSKLGKLFGKRRNHDKEESGYKLFINGIEQEVIPVYKEKRNSPVLSNNNKKQFLLPDNEMEELSKHDYARLDRFIQFLHEVLSQEEIAALKDKASQEVSKGQKEWEKLSQSLSRRRNSTSSTSSMRSNSTSSRGSVVSEPPENLNMNKWTTHLSNLEKIREKITKIYELEKGKNESKALEKNRKLLALHSELELAAHQFQPNYKLYELLDDYLEDVSNEIFKFKNSSNFSNNVKKILNLLYEDVKVKNKRANSSNSGRANSEVTALTMQPTRRKYYFLPNIKRYTPRNNISYNNKNKKLFKYFKDLEKLKEKFFKLPESTNDERKRKDYVYHVLINLDAKKDNYQEHELVDILGSYIDGSLVEKIRKDIINLGNKNLSSNNKYVLGHYWKMLKKPSNTNKMTAHDFLDVVTAIDEIKQSQRGGFGNSLHTIDLHVNGKDFKITKKSSSMLGKLTLQGEAHYELIVSQGTYTKSYFNNGTLKQVVQVIYEELPHHVCDFIDQLAKKAREDSSWNHLLESLYCDRNKNRAFLNYESKKRNEENLLNRISKFGNWLKSNKKRQEIFSGLDERKKYELYGSPNGDLDYERLKFDIESQADFEKWLEKNSNRQEIFNSLSNNKLNTFTKKNGSYDYDKLRILIQVKSNEQKNKGFFKKYF